MWRAVPGSAGVRVNSVEKLQKVLTPIPNEPKFSSTEPENC